MNTCSAGRTFVTLALGATAIFAQETTSVGPAPIGIIRGDLVKYDATGSRGELEVRETDSRVVSCGFDARTYFERDNQRITPAAMSAGDRLEMVADHKPGTTACYARTVHVIDATVARRPPSRLRREALNPTELFAPRGDLTYAGVVVRMNPESLVLRTRGEGEKTLLIRTDTRYIGGGVRVDPAVLKVQTRVFIRAGKNLDGDVEAYQVIWGEIIRPE